MEKKNSAFENDKKDINTDTLFIQHLSTHQEREMISVFGRRPKEGQAHLTEAAAAKAVIVHDSINYKKRKRGKMYTKNGVEMTHGMDKSTKTFKK
jgi:hypothetical protein